MSAQTARDNSMYPHLKKQETSGKKIKFEQPFLTSSQLKQNNSKVTMFESAKNLNDSSKFLQ